MRLRRLGLRTFSLLPKWVRRSLVHLGKPGFTVGAVGVVVADDRLLLARQSYRKGWAVPGGLLDRGETPAAAVVRELWEEVGVAVDLEDHPWVAVDPGFRRVDIIFRGHLAGGVAPADARPVSAEIVEVGWFALDDLPDLQAEAVQALRLVGYNAEISRWLRRRSPGAPSARTGDGAS